MINGNEEMKTSLRSFLSFYRENRDLVAALAGSPPSPPQKKESRPQSETGTNGILEEYLRRAVQENR